ncbi:hypothetical protein LO771_20100 [Streptacidiphilus sp. ASG 303]|uniref:hypothetical protein n=1 Tax=Streptacidiphilus sp. ASG 303 TaxID=2896847 RepID=UPI001E57884E|nr:hypothetical protein [Streptacidiphilus sp. ASG 303]MCD0484631.1 hypothetical protein [Streptacidiphilus sp. ASG 303]
MAGRTERAGRHGDEGGGRGRLLVLLAAAGAARAVYAALDRVPPGEPALWERRNGRGRVVTLYQGPAVAVAAATAVAAAPQLPPPVRAAAALAAVAGAGAGVADDMAGGKERGLRAHLAALRRGRVTGGAVRLAGVGAAGLAAGCLLHRNTPDRLLAAAVVAGTAGAADLLDARPGRAAKAVVAAGLPTVLRGGPGAAAAAAPVGAAAALLPDDLGERTTPGTGGALALGAALGTAWAAGSGRTGLAVRAAALLALHAAAGRGLYGEGWWARQPLRALDRAGRAARPSS